MIVIFFGDTVSENIEIINDKINIIEYESKSLVPSSITFDWVIESDTLTNWQGFIEHNENYGISFNAILGTGEFNISYERMQLKAQKNGDNEVISYEGIEPYLEIGKNILRIKSNYKTKSFTIKYKKAIAL